MSSQTAGRVVVFTAKRPLNEVLCAIWRGP
jgi:hypothetical protein